MNGRRPRAQQKRGITSKLFGFLAVAEAARRRRAAAAADERRMSRLGIAGMERMEITETDVNRFEPIFMELFNEMVHHGRLPLDNPGLLKMLRDLQKEDPHKFEQFIQQRLQELVEQGMQEMQAMNKLKEGIGEGHAEAFMQMWAMLKKDPKAELSHFPRQE